jgi:hypothetical protein
MKYEQKPNTGVLFKNNKKETDRHPDYTGNILLSDGEYMVSAWVKDGKSGKFFSLSVKKKDQLSGTVKNATSQNTNDLPF